MLGYLNVIKTLIFTTFGAFFVEPKSVCKKIFLLILNISKDKKNFVNVKKNLINYQKSIYEIRKFKDSYSEKYLILTSFYPSNEDIYKRMFIHTRVKQYINKGLNVTVLVPTNGQSEEYYYEGVKVILEKKKKLHLVIDKIKPRCILIHIPYQSLIKAVERSRSNAKCFIWIHGAEAELSTRRSFNYENNESHYEKLKRTTRDAIRMKFNASMYKNPKYHFIFVSCWLKEVAEKDANEKIQNYSIIPNVINTNLFKFNKKSKDKVYKILSIRPYNSKTYANDISVNTVLELSKHKIFEKLEFSFYGKGELFDETLEPLKKFKNVKIYNKFLHQSEIKVAHDNHGIFLCPSRHDTQGVSLGEAVSSGLVGVTNNVAAIPEFFNENEIVFCKKEDHLDMSNKIIELCENYEKFENISKNGSKKIKNSLSEEYTIEREISLITRNSSELITKNNIRKIKDYNIAIISDDFTFHSITPEANFYYLTPSNYKDYFSKNVPDLFLCESTWEGLKSRGSEWRGLVRGEPSREIKEILHICKLNNIKTVFWNKEDPVNFDKFIDIAKLFDVIFTTAEEMIPEYKKQGCEKVFSLMFATQPKIFNPIKDFNRKSGFFFAGSYYGFRKDRCREMNGIFDWVLNNNYALDIYDRNYYNNYKKFKYPSKYSSLLKPSLSTLEIAKKYKAYEFGININTVKNSKTMFARRVFELLSSNTYILTNESIGMESLFSKWLTVYKPAVAMQIPDEKEIYKNKYFALQEVLKNHTYQKRLERIISKASLKYIDLSSELLIFSNSKTNSIKYDYFDKVSFFDLNDYCKLEELVDKNKDETYIFIEKDDKKNFVEEAYLACQYLKEGTILFKNENIEEYTYFESNTDRFSECSNFFKYDSSIEKYQPFNLSHFDW